MPRVARKKSNTGIYHIMLRGADRRTIFADAEDCRHFLETLKQVKQGNRFCLYAYCLMGNHAHLLIKEDGDTLETIFKRIGSSYVYYYNWKYQLHGHLFQDRFRSEAIEDDAYFLDVLRYICQNPIKASLCKSPFEYPWLGCSGVTDAPELLDSIEALTDLRGDRLIQFVMTPCNETHLEETPPKRLTDQEAAERICAVCGCKNVQEIGGWKAKQRDLAIQKALDSGISIRQLSRLTAVSKTLIERVVRQKA